MSTPDTNAVQTYLVELQARLCQAFERADGGARFRQDAWERSGGGGGVSRVLADGAVFGSYYYWQQSINLTVWGPVTCINVVGNHAWMAGNVEGVSGNPDFADLVGTESWWQVFDNTYYGMPDVSTGLGAAAAPAAAPAPARLRSRR